MGTELYALQPLVHGLTLAFLFGLAPVALTHAQVPSRYPRTLVRSAVFGLGSAAAIASAATLPSGLHLDMGEVLLAIAGLFCGIAGALVAGAIAILAKLGLSGFEAWASCVPLALTALSAAGVHHLAVRERGRPAIQEVLATAILAGSIATGWVIFGFPAGRDELNLVGTVVFLMHFAGVLALGLVIRAAGLTTEVKQARERAEDMLQAVFDTATDAIFINEPLPGGDVRLIAANRMALEKIGLPEPQAVGKLASQILPPQRFDKLREAVNEVVRSGSPLAWEEESVTHGLRRDWEVHLVPFRTSESRPLMLCCSYRDITWRKEAERAMQTAAMTDALTGLFNRRHADSVLELECKRSSRYSQPLSVLILDIDHFKRINDTYGHDVGDDVLRHLGRLLMRQARLTDIVARWGGEEFLLIAPQTDLHGAILVAERIRQEVKTMPIDVGNGRLRITVSIGVAELVDHSSPASLVKEADQMLYQAKQSGRDRIRPKPDGLSAGNLQAPARA